MTGIDDHSRFCVCARLVARATARPVCDALAGPCAPTGCPTQILTDNGKVFTARFGKGPGPVLFDRICADNGIRHLLTAPYSPTTTGKVERFHKTLRAEWVAPNDYRLRHHRRGPGRPGCLGRPLQHRATPPEPGHGRRPASGSPWPPVARSVETVDGAPARRGPRHPPGRCAAAGSISGATSAWPASATGSGPTFAGEPVEVVCQRGLVEILHAGVVVATHAQRRPADPKASPRPAPSTGRARAATVGADACCAWPTAAARSASPAPAYRAGRSWARRQIDVAIVGASVQLSVDGKVIRVHPIRHDRTKEHGAFATPNGRPRKARTA